MMHISEFAKLCGTTVKTLRHYARVGVLLPDYVSQKNGYRYYRKRSAERYFQIRALQENGLTLREISEKLADRQGVIKLLDARANVLQAQVERCKALRAEYEAALLRRKRYTVSENHGGIQVCCEENGEIWLQSEAACKTAFMRMLDRGLNEEQVIALSFFDLQENLQGCTACSDGVAYSADCDAKCMEDTVGRELGEITEVLLLHFSCSPDVSLEMLGGVIEDFLLSFQEKVTILFSADTEYGTVGVFLEWVCLRKTQ